MSSDRLTPPRLVVLSISPWSERARWALDHHEIAYQRVEHVPFIGEGKLRRLVGAASGRVTVPVLLTGERVLTESWDIALHADREGKKSKLIPRDKEDEIRAWNTLADETMASGRALVVAATLASPEALDEGLPPNVPALVRRLARPVTRHGMKWFAQKYGLQLDEREAQLAKLRSTLVALRRALSGGSPYLLGSFSYADIVMATCLQGVSPVAGRYIRLGPGTRKAWTLEELATEFQDLIAWRDRLYEQHRG